MKNNKSVFISYDWSTIQHREWVRQLANHLRENAIEATIDIFEIQKGSTNLNKMMVENIERNDYIILVLTKEYAEKANSFTGGVGFENSLALSLLKESPEKFILLVKEETGFSSAVPFHFKGHYFIDFTKANDYQIKLDELLHKLHDADYWFEQPIGQVPPHIKMKQKKLQNPPVVTHIEDNNRFERNPISTNTENLPTLHINELGILDISDEELEVIMSEVSNNISQGINPPVKFVIEQEEKIKNKIDFLLNSNLTDIERRRIKLEEKEFIKKFEKYTLKVENLVHLFLNPNFTFNPYSFTTQPIQTFRELINLQQQASVSQKVKVDIYHFVNQNLYFSFYLNSEEWDLLSESQKETINIRGYNFASEIPLQIRNKKLIPHYVNFLHNQFSVSNIAIPDEAENLYGDWFFSLA